MLLPNVSLQEVMNIFGANNVTEVYLKIQEICSDELAFKKAFKKPEWKQILRDD